VGNKNKSNQLIIKPQSSLLSIDLAELWRYRDLLRMMIRRDFVTYYKQTILGPLWFFVQPIFTTITYVFIFGNLAGISTDGLPQPLFYMAGITIWNYFADCLNKVSSVFKDNQAVFGKVYFPRLVTPLSIVISNLIKLGIQFLLFFGMMVYFGLFTESSFQVNQYALLLPFLIALLAGLGLGLGMLISSLTTKYRDLAFLLAFGIQLFMYATPVIYPLSAAPEKYRWIIELNPITSIVETFRYGFLGTGMFDWYQLLYSTVFTIVLLLLGTLVFNKTEKTFMDTV
jgi:lipopolysaccharide transport system permease protein